MASIRPMTPADYPVVAAITREAAQRALVGRPVWETAEEIARELASLSQAEFIVAEDADGNVTGMAGYALDPFGEAILYGPLVTVAGHGIGAWLAGRIEAMARQNGAGYYSMLIGLNNRGGAAWADWRGYQLASEQPEMLMTWVYPGELRPVRMADAAVRPATPADLGRIYELYQESFPTGRIEERTWARLLPECSVVELNGRVEGFLRIDRATAWIDHLCVAHALRRQGLGARLLTGAIERFWEERHEKVGLAVPLDNTAPVSLFRQLGFRLEIPVAKWMKRES